MKIVVGFLAGLLVGVTVASLWGDSTQSGLRRDLARSQKECFEWRELAGLREEELQEAYKELGQ